MDLYSSGLNGSLQYKRRSVRGTVGWYIVGLHVMRENGDALIVKTEKFLRDR